MVPKGGGLRLAHCGVGCMYECGHEVNRDFKEAMRWYRRTVYKGRAASQDASAPHYKAESVLCRGRGGHWRGGRCGDGAGARGEVKAGICGSFLFCFVLTPQREKLARKSHGQSRS